MYAIFVCGEKYELATPIFAPLGKYWIFYVSEPMHMGYVSRVFLTLAIDYYS